MSSPFKLPKITIVTPSYNQAQYVGATIESVLSQNYPNLEYIVMDGGSTDGSWEVIKTYESGLHHCSSGPDQGQYDAINRGFHHGTGEIMAWLNSDDKYTPWAFQVVSEIFSTLPEVEWLTTLSPIVWSTSGAAAYCGHRGGYTRRGFMHGENILEARWSTLGTLQQESVFWRRSLWERAGGYVDTAYKLAADFELWARFFQHANLYTVESPLGGFRQHGNQRSVNQVQEYIEESRQILKRYDGQPAGAFKGAFKKVLKDYVRLPRSVRKLAVKLKLKDPHRLCVYSCSEQIWQVDEI
ncbi:glycosyltransferase family 2 protein [Pseudanabaena sp. FACHB-2040]|uniref:glycosyltransferase family 2 protein n=1 Tax=Pseudanabaena sp. FACHB-2040 TaxID=2692859 RepID=UPI0016831B41|nr:glycosyltransferase family 2 protein [Pseudanabaena sp. FACHB-2040]MBD2260792.1 glycosyltransferase [Pseudanabaena sp. FACHB-2040]